MAAQLPDKIHKKITNFCKNGDKLYEQGNYDAALAEYRNALDLIPPPFNVWEASTWILTALGDTYSSKKEYHKSHRVFTDAMTCPGAVGNPYIHLRLGESQFELGDMDKAKDEMVRAYMGAGEEIFLQEDPKYFALVRDTIDLS